MVTVKAIVESEHYKTTLTSSLTGNALVADEPLAKGGQGLGFNPDEFLASALASCTAITLRLYADRKNWPLQQAEIEVIFERNDETGASTFTRNINLIGTLDQEQKDRLMFIAEKCPIHKTLTNKIDIITTLA